MHPAPYGSSRPCQGQLDCPTGPLGPPRPGSGTRLTHTMQSRSPCPYLGTRPHGIAPYHDNVTTAHTQAMPCAQPQSYRPQTHPADGKSGLRAGNQQAPTDASPRGQNMKQRASPLKTDRWALRTLLALTFRSWAMATSESLTRLNVAYPIGDASRPPRLGIEARQRAGFAPSTDEPLLTSHPGTPRMPPSSRRNHHGRHQRKAQILF